MRERNDAIRNRRGFVKTLVVTVGCLLAMTAAALAVEQTGDLRGTVRDEKGQPLPGTTVTLAGPNLQGERAAQTDVNGEYTFRALPPGIYAVKLSAPGYQVTELDKVVVSIGRTTTVFADLTPGQMTETVSVTGKAPLVDTVRTQTQDNYTPDYLENVQIGSGGRDYLSVIANSAGTGPGDGGNPTVRGSTLGGNVYLVDGVDTTDPVTATFGTNFIFDAIQEVQFQTGGFEAEFGRATGGIANTVTKSGGNQFSGSLDARYRNENFIEKGEHFDPGDLDIKREIAEGTFGGPIVKDKLWFFLAGSYIQSDAGAAGTPSVFSFGGRYYLGKLTWQLNPNHRLIAQITADPATIDNADASSLVAEEATSKQTQGSKFFTAQYQGVLGPNVILHAQAAAYRSKLDSEPQSGDFGTIGRLDFITGVLSENAIDAQFSDRYRNQVNATVTWEVPKLAGEHTFKFGADLQKMKFEFEQFIPGGAYLDVAPDAMGVSTPLLYNEDNPAGLLKNAGTLTAFFVQDGWRLHPRITVNAGLRYDTFAFDDDSGRRVLEAHLLQPRLGVAWDATGDARNVFKVYGGRFNDPSLLALPRVVNSRANATDLFINENIAGWFFDNPPGPTPFDFDGNGMIEDHVFVTTFGGPGGAEFAHGGKLDATSVVEYSASYERQLNPSTAGGITLVRRKTYDIIEDVFDAARGVYVIDNVGTLGRNYYGAELRFRTIWKRLNLYSSYTWSRSRGNIEYTQSLGTDWDFPVHRTSRYGYLADDTRHFVRLNGYYDLPLEFQVAFGYFYASGFPFNQLQSVTPYGEQFVEPRGSRRMPDLHQLDVGFKKGFTIGKTDLSAIVAVNNVFDTEIVTQVNQLAGQNGQAVNYQTPRRYEIGAHFRF